MNNMFNNGEIENELYSNVVKVFTLEFAIEPQQEKQSNMNWMALNKKQ